MHVDYTAALTRMRSMIVTESWKESLIEIKFGV